VLVESEEMLVDSEEILVDSEADDEAYDVLGVDVDDIGVNHIEMGATESGF